MTNSTQEWFEVDRDAITRNLYLCTFSPTAPTPLDELAAEYHERCETYDRLVCTGPIIDNSIMPATHDERRLIERNARTVLAELTDRARCLGYTYRQLIEVIHSHA
jgi:hypothetical protein